MPDYEEDHGFQPIGPVNPVNRIDAMRALRVKQARLYQGDRKARTAPKNSAKREEEGVSPNPAVILDISPEAREQAHHLTEQASDEDSKHLPRV